MPKIPASSTDTSNVLLPFVCHGVDFTSESASNQAIADCPLCDRESKFYVNKDTGQWSCYGCTESGNAIQFLRVIHEKGFTPTDRAALLAKDRGILNPDTLHEWVVSIPLTSSYMWTVPGYSAVSKDVVQLYRYLPDPKTKKKRLVATSGLPHGLHGVNLFDDSKPDVYVCEGPWDAMVLREVLAFTKREADGSLIYTPNPEVSLLNTSNVLAVPGCKVFNESWSAIMGGKKVYLLYDNDHPRPQKLKNGTEFLLPPDGLEGMKSAANVLANSEKPPHEIYYLQWGVEDLTYNPALKHGYDVRDALTTTYSPSERVKAWADLASKFQPIPSTWLGGKTLKNGNVQLQSLPCEGWRHLTDAWRKAVRWTPGLERALAVMLASVVSTGHVGDQLWIKVISCASSGKTMLCEALSVARDFVLPKSTTRGFHSGYKSDKDGTQDHSLIPLLRGKTLVTKDGDTLLSSPARDVILSEGRDLYDRVSRAHYKNGLDRDYEDVSMTWILCGTAGLRILDSSELGERFLTCSIMDTIDPVLERQVVRRSISHIRDNLGTMINGTAESRETKEKTEAKQKTGGYVEYLRKNAPNLYRGISSSELVETRCMELGEFVARMRARPSKRQEEIAEREFSVRLSNQLYLLAASLAVVLNRSEIDSVVMGHVNKVALDTASGRTLSLASHLYTAGTKGVGTATLAVWTGQEEEKEAILLRFLKRIDVVELHSEELAPGVRGQPKWRLTERMRYLYSTCVPEGYKPT